MSAITATRNPAPTSTPLALTGPRFSKPTSGRSVVPGTAAPVGGGRPRLRIVADGEQAPVITRITPAPVSEPVDLSSSVEPVETLRRVALDEFFAPVPGGESQRLVVLRPRAARLTRRGRTVVMGLSLAVALGLGVLWASGSAATEHPEQTRVVRVHTGDTLWDISSAAATATGGGDVRSMMSTIEQLNHLDSAVLQAGQTIRVPQ
jgi:hypothetical protein